MSAQVNLEVFVTGSFIWTVRALDRLGVYTPVLPQNCTATERLATVSTCVGFLACVYTTVVVQLSLDAERFPTDVAGIRLFSCVYADMGTQMTRLVKQLPAVLTLITDHIKLVGTTSLPFLQFYSSSIRPETVSL